MPEISNFEAIVTLPAVRIVSGLGWDMTNGEPIRVPGWFTVDSLGELLRFFREESLAKAELVRAETLRLLDIADRLASEL